MKRSRLFGWSLLLLIAYCTLGAVVYFASLLLVQRGMVLDVPWIISAQKALYRAGMTNQATNWMGLPGCITSDPDLVYKPSIGACRFDHIEFDITLTFTDKGRVTGTRPAGTGIAVIGDSHAMGWGVDDEETYAARLQALSGRPVYNLGVASYGTARELIRLDKSGLVDQVDTVIIQYCNNDYNENLQFDSASRGQLHDKVFGQPRSEPASPPGKAKQIARGYWLTLKAPFSSLANKLRRKNFNRHYGPLLSAMRKHYDVLRGKRVIVFYSNPFGQKYRNYPSGPDPELPNVSFVDLGLDWTNYYRLDGHLTPAGHRRAAERLYRYLQTESPSD